MDGVKDDEETSKLKSPVSIHLTFSVSYVKNKHSIDRTLQRQQFSANYLGIFNYSSYLHFKGMRCMVEHVRLHVVQ